MNDASIVISPDSSWLTEWLDGRLTYAIRSSKVLRSIRNLQYFTGRMHPAAMALLNVLSRAMAAIGARLE